MIILILFAFVAGIVTILSPCILPILPVVLSGSVTGGKKRPYGVITGFILSFTVFTLFFSAIVKATGISANSVRLVSVLLIVVFGLTLVVPPLQGAFERLASKLSGLAPRQKTGEGFSGGFLIGISLGLIWTPCVGPILASVISLAATSVVGGEAVLITLAYAAGTAIPLLLITHGGRTLLGKNTWLLTHGSGIQKAFGVLMIATAVGLVFNVDRKFQTYILTVFPDYGAGLTALENNAFVAKELSVLERKSKAAENGIGNMADFLRPDLGMAPDLVPGGQWFNSQPLTLPGLRGKVVLVDFWTYTCINCIRTLPYLKAWHEKYSDKGLVIIGVHTPEFEFEKDAKNVAQAIRDFGILYPVMQDNEYATWNAYDNRFWPAKYLIDKDGRIVYTHFGEGEYDKTEEVIQRFLGQTGSDVTNLTVANPAYTVSAGTRETYLGYRRLEFLSSPQTPELFTPVRFSLPDPVPVNTFALEGTWTVSDFYAAPLAGDRLVFHFDATDVYLVMRPKTEGATGKIRISVDGNEPGALSGTDAAGGIVTVDSDRLYNLLKLGTRGRHILEMEFLDGTLELYAFTFG